MVGERRHPVLRLARAFDVEPLTGHGHGQLRAREVIGAGERDELRLQWQEPAFLISAENLMMMYQG